MHLAHFKDKCINHLEKVFKHIMQSELWNPSFLECGDFDPILGQIWTNPAFGLHF